MILSAQFIILKILNKFFGLAPINVKLKNHKVFEKIFKSIPIILTTSLSMCTATYLLYHPIFESSGTIHGIINFASLLSVSFSIISGNAQCFFYSSAYETINDRIRSIEKDFTKKISPQFTINLSLQYRRKVYSIIFLFFVSQAILFYEVQHITGTNGMWSSFLTSSLRFIFPLEVLHVVLYTDIISMFVKEISLSLDDPSKFFYASTKFELLKNIKIMHMDLWKLVAQVNRYFGWNLLCLLVKLFVYITLLLYWVFIAINNEVDVLGLVGKYWTYEG